MIVGIHIKILTMNNKSIYIALLFTIIQILPMQLHNILFQYNKAN